ncbi:hypothetical protein HPODL_05318 [Ogataea parapolymorpha DL-1]|uniref:Uncharacterized protein n=1 Tax=Ogataea parapolymorpha (strain ATCC 26012 / BCRC 20466 / JCM 22074 / NRRL Y-7560 / DL-1) TaxID=871575 RepID=W1QBL5_OGAPD|nr:hypothetical protein HPODL_05318 [Ogataea parapolymorpha DL-1]ESW97789.1 hypothetical protein HPODL_05318 [Ogataea parapolymorpha DL-1]
MEDVKTILETLRLDPQRGLRELECRLERRPGSDGGMSPSPEPAVNPDNWQVVVDELLEMLAVPEMQWTWFRPKEPREQKISRQHKQAQLHALRQVLQFTSVYDRYKLLDRVSLYYDERHPWSSKESAQAVHDILCQVEPSKDEIFVLMDGYVPMLRKFGKVSQHRTKVSAGGYRKSQNAADGSIDTPLVGREPVGEDERIRTKYMSRIGSLAFLVDFLQGSDIEARWNVIFLLLLHYLDDHDVLVKSSACEVLQTVVAKVNSPPSMKNIIARSSVAGLLLDTIAPCLLALPSLTPPEESRMVLPTAYATAIAVLTASTGAQDELERQIAWLLVDYALPGVARAGEYPQVCGALLSVVATELLPRMGAFAAVVAKQTCYGVLELLRNPYTAFSPATIDAAVAVLEQLAAQGRGLASVRYDVLACLLKVAQRLHKYEVRDADEVRAKIARFVLQLDLTQQERDRVQKFLLHLTQ